MRKTSCAVFLAISALLLLALAAGGCGSSNKEGAAAPIAQPSPTGDVQAQILSVSGGASPVVTFRLLDQDGAPLDPNELLAPTKLVNGTLPTGGRLRFFIARIEPDGYYRNYKRASDNAAAFNFLVPSYEGAAASRLAEVSPGTWTYTFKLNIDNSAQTLWPPGGSQGITLSDNVAGGGTARGLTHTVAIQIARTITLPSGKELEQVQNPYFNYRPDGGAVTATREIAPISTCNECHYVLGIHGGTRRDVALCILCHYPGITEEDNGNSIDMKVMVHKIHMGKKLPSNVAGGDWKIGNASWKTVGYPFWSRDGLIDQTPVDCVKCHKAGKDYAGKAYGKDVARHKANPTYNKCVTCHDMLSFNGVKSIVVKNGPTPITVTDDNVIMHDNMSTQIITFASEAEKDNTAKCSSTNCHAVQAVIDNAAAIYNWGSVPAAHTVLEKSSIFTGINFQILSVDNAVKGLAPTVRVKVTTDNGAAINVLSADASFNLKLGVMPNGVDYTNAGMNAEAQPFSKSLKPSAVSNGDGSYTVTFDNVIPAGATGVGVIGAEGRWTYRFPPTARRGASATANVGGKAVQYYFDVATGAQVADPARQRRVSVDAQKCDGCHFRLEFHGGNRNENVQQCVICHNPRAVLDGTSTFNFKDMVHYIHTGENMDPAFAAAYFGGRFAEMRYPRDRKDCLACHVAKVPIAYGIPLPAGVLGTATDNLGTVRNPTASACVTCHMDTTFTAPHVASQTSGTTEFCASCHTSGLLVGPDFAHQPVRAFPPE